MKSYRYVEYTLKRKSFPDFLKAVKYKVDLKEWTETIGMINFIKDNTQSEVFDVIFDIGCGKRPTMAVLMALNIKSFKNIIAIDPQLDTGCAFDISGLTLFNATLKYHINLLKEHNEPNKIFFKNALICCNHSHVPKKEIMELIKLCENWIYVTNPCCVDNKLDRGIYYSDKHIWSNKNEIFLFRSKNLKGEK